MRRARAARDPGRRALRRAARGRTPSSRFARRRRLRGAPPVPLRPPIPRKPGDAPVTCLNLVDGEWRRTAELVADAVARRPPRDALRARALARGRLRARDRPGARLLERRSSGRTRGSPTASTSSRTSRASSQLLLRGVPRRAAPADAEDAARGRQGFLGSQARGRSPRGQRREGDDGRARPDDDRRARRTGRTRTCRPGVCTVITPMNFIYGIPGIQIVGCYLSGSPLHLQGPPLQRDHDDDAHQDAPRRRRRPARGAQGRGLRRATSRRSSSDPRVAVVSVTGSAETAKAIQAARGVRPVRFEGGGCNWSWIDDGFSDDELGRIAARLAYSKLGLGSHKCTTLHGVAASTATLDRFEPMVVAEMKAWKVADPRAAAARRDEDREPAHGAQGAHGDEHPGERARGGRPGAPRGRPGHRRATTPTTPRWRRPVVLGRVTPETQRASSTGTASRRRSRSRRPSSSCPSWCTMEVAGLRGLRALLPRGEPARPRDEPLDPRRREALARAPDARRDAQGERRHRQRARVGGVRRERGRARAATPAWATPRRRSPCSAAGRRAATSSSDGAGPHAPTVALETAGHCA